MNKKSCSFAVILPAAGSGTRFGEGDKLLVDIGGKSVLQRSVGLFAGRADVGLIVLVTGRERFEGYRTHIGEVGTEVAFVEGGRERWESVLFGLRYVAGREEPFGFVAVHDAARPLCPAGVIEEAFSGAAAGGAALPCVAEPATLKRRGEGGQVGETVDRRGLYQAQTPQCFDVGRLLEGYEALLKNGRVSDLTDDAQVFERMGWPVRMTGGSVRNLKITTAEDLDLAQALVQMGEK